MAITLSIFNRFLKFFHCCTEKLISNKTRIILPTILSVCCHANLWKLEIQLCGNLQKIQSKVVSHLTETETSRHMTECCHNSCQWWGHHWQCNWRVTWTSLRMRPGKGGHFEQLFIVTTFSHMTRRFSFCAMPCQTCRKYCFSSQHFFR